MITRPSTYPTIALSNASWPCPLSPARRHGSGRRNRVVLSPASAPKGIRRSRVRAGCTEQRARTTAAAEIRSAPHWHVGRSCARLSAARVRSQFEAGQRPATSQCHLGSTCPNMGGTRLQAAGPDATAAACACQTSRLLPHSSQSGSETAANSGHLRSITEYDPTSTMPCSGL